jgi:chitin synthase
MLEKGKNLINPLVAAQNFEYKMSNILDKPLESAFGFITVLPGAFSAYRFVALQNDKTGQGPLERYFLGEKMHGANAGIFTANMYLAEDRILCWELVSKRNCSWILQYVKSATGETDVPTEMSDFILQRRRWLNGSFFAAVYALAHFYEIGRSRHSFLRKFMFMIEFFYQAVNMIFAWFAIVSFVCTTVHFVEIDANSDVLNRATSSSSSTSSPFPSAIQSSSARLVSSSLSFWNGSMPLSSLPASSSRSAIDPKEAAASI